MLVARSQGRSVRGWVDGVVVAMVICAFLFAPLFAPFARFARGASSLTATVVEVFVCSCVCVFVCVRVCVCSCVRVFVCGRSLPPSLHIYIYIYTYICIYLYFNRAAPPRPAGWLAGCCGWCGWCVTSAGARYEKHPPRHSIAPGLTR